MPDAPLRLIDKLTIALLLSLSIGAGVMTEIRGVYLQRRQTDIGCYLRAAWAVRTGVDPYSVTDDNGWHYNYPTLFAIVLVPFADAPTGTPQPELAVPYRVTVAVWYVVSLLLLAWSAHHLCTALEETHPKGPQPAGIGTRRFWWVRTWPVWLCVPAIASTVLRGQVNVMIVAFLTGCIVATIRGRSARAGWWLAAAVCVKVIPALLVLYPLVRRDWRMLGHFALGCLVGLVLIPVIAMGPQRAWDTSETYVNQTLLPGLTTRPGVVAKELTDMTATDNQSIRAIIHAFANANQERLPTTASTGTKIAHALLSVALIGATFLAARRIADERYKKLFLLSALIIVCVAATPVNHTHYMAMAFPAVLGLVFWEMERRGSFRWSPALIAVALLHVASGILPRLPFLPGYQAARDFGITMLGTLLVWLAVLWLPAATRARSKAAPTESGSVLRLPSGTLLK